MDEASTLSESEYNSAFAAFEEAVEVARGQVGFAAILGCTQGNISQLLTKRRLLPARHVLKVERATGVSRHDLRPDLYPREDASAVPPPPPVARGGSAGSCERRSGLQLGEPVR